MKLALFRFLAFLFLLPGLLSLVVDASLSTHYFDTRPHEPQPDQGLTVPRILNGQVIYLTEGEDKGLEILRYYGLRSFAVGIGIGLIYMGGIAANLERWNDIEPTIDPEPVERPSSEKRGIFEPAETAFPDRPPAGIQAAPRQVRMRSSIRFGSGFASMKTSKLVRLRVLALLFLIPGLAGLIASAVMSTGYLDMLPRSPASDEVHVVPRNIHGTVVYQTVEQDRRLSLTEDSSVGVFLIGLLIGLIYLERWGSMRSTEPEPGFEIELDEDELSAVNSK